ncbi:RHS repeat-associated core domain-containing protein [Pseudomonas fluorescens]|jgi:RHS repeat-associated protein|uniref:RHS repeat-associated core domain-containing protein n=1 Tax=Pseudomonas fluorescens TaxID=294 RepID=UPI001911315C|nr:RHS repeat-associated core domain-containing protein [Pseudomonas fluorescens]
MDDTEPPPIRIGDQSMAMHGRKTILLATEYSGSVLSAVDTTGNTAITYTPYGDAPTDADPLSQLRFNGALRESMTGCYSLGNGYRMYSPVLMRFLSPDEESPFEEGWLNAYAYCGGDPRNREDRTGRSWIKILTSSDSIARIPRLQVQPKAVGATLSNMPQITRNTQYQDRNFSSLARYVGAPDDVPTALAEPPRRTSSVSKTAASSSSAPLKNSSDTTKMQLKEAPGEKNKELAIMRSEETPTNRPHDPRVAQKYRRLFAELSKTFPTQQAHLKALTGLELTPTTFPDLAAGIRKYP